MGHIEDAIGRLLAYKAFACLGVLLEGTLLAEVMLAARDDRVLTFLPRPTTYVAGKRQIIIFTVTAASSLVL